jgi:hypothetical protein
MRLEMTDAEQAETIALTREPLLFLAKKQVLPSIAHSALIQTLMELIKLSHQKDTLEAAADLIETLQHAMKNSAN